MGADQTGTDQTGTEAAGTGERWRVAVDRGICVGSGMCVHHAPEDFTLDTARQARPRTPETRPNAPVLRAAEGCPVEAISLTLIPTGTPVFPPAD
ncbi:ferredoxin [Streptomyces sp. NPDC051567]|uniref:ferredoxin n=1 Tax=Streptomyces sp. NPDC051567 TaxID=3365660 RepID=UPI003790FA6F